VSESPRITVDDTPQVTVEKLQQILWQLHKSEEWTIVSRI